VKYLKNLPLRGYNTREHMSKSITPSHLSKKSKRTYRHIVSTYVLDDTQLTLLTHALEQDDIAERAWDVIKEGIVYVTDAGVSKPCPEIAIQRQALALSNKLMAQLDLNHAKRIRPEETFSQELDRVRMRAEIEQEAAHA
jgi:hypothetical protein